MRRRRIWILLIIVMMVVLGIGATTYWLLVGRQASPLPRTVVAQVDFPVYFPSPMPSGYTLKADSAGGDNNTVYYTLTDGTDKTAITVTIQATPAKFDASQLIGKNPIPTSISPVGTLYNLSTGGSSKYMLTTGKTLLFITSPKEIDGKVIDTITSNLAEIRTK